MPFIRIFRIRSLVFSLLSGTAVLCSQLSVAESLDGEALSKTCVACHGADGKSSSPIWPNLAGQKAGYMATQITAFRDGERSEPTMQPFIANLSDAQVKAVADYYAALPLPSPTQGEVNEAGKNVRAACISCHGMAGNTVNEAWPNLAGQHKEYLEKQLLAFKSGERKAPLMNVIAGELSDQQISDVAEYYSQIAK